MSALSPIAKIEFKVAPQQPSPDWGPEPELKWLPLDCLRVDFSYQRDILAAGKTTIRQIIEEFRWSRFGQIVVAPREDGLYSIADGQHRAAACLYLGIAKVPCMIVKCSIEEEAEAFASMNNNVTRPSPLQIYNAKLIAGDRRARQLRAVCQAAGVIVPRSAIVCDKPGMCTAIVALQKCLATFGEEVLTVALKLLVDGGGNVGLLGTSIIGGLCDVLWRNSRFVKRPAELKAALDSAGVDKLYKKAKRVQAVDGGSSRAHFVAAIVRHLEREGIAAR